MLENNPLISIVIPTYNQAEFLRDALQSVCAQTYEHWEAIVVNNYSEDETISVVQAINDERIKLINFKNHGIIAASRNEGIRAAKGEFVAFLDSDDRWYPNKLFNCVSMLTQGYDLVCHGEHWLYADGLRKSVLYGPMTQAFYARLLYQGNCISTSATVVRTQLLNQLGGFSTETAFITAEDYELWLRIAQVTGKIYFLNELLGEYRLHDMSASSHALRHQAAILAVINKHHICQKQSMLLAIRYRRRCARLMISIAKLKIIRRDFFCAWGRIFRAFILWPIGWKNYAALAWIVVVAMGDKMKKSQ